MNVALPFPFLDLERSHFGHRPGAECCPAGHARIRSAAGGQQRNLLTARIYTAGREAVADAVKKRSQNRRYPPTNDDYIGLNEIDHVSQPQRKKLYGVVQNLPGQQMPTPRIELNFPVFVAALADTESIADTTAAMPEVVPWLATIGVRV